MSIIIYHELGSIRPAKSKIQVIPPGEDISKLHKQVVQPSYQPSILHGFLSFSSLLWLHGGITYDQLTEEEQSQVSATLNGDVKREKGGKILPVLKALASVLFPSLHG